MLYKKAVEEIRLEDLESLPKEAFSPAAREFVAQVFRVFSHPHAFDYGAALNHVNIRYVYTNFSVLSFLVQVWAAFRLNGPDAAFNVHKYRNLAWLHFREATGAESEREDSLVVPLWELTNLAARREAYFLAHAVEAVTDAWCEEPLTSEQVSTIANAAMEYACDSCPEENNE